MSYNSNGKILTVVKNMYNNIKSCISIHWEHSDYFQCHQGLRQGEYSSPEWENYLSVNGAYCIEINDNDLNVYLKLFVWLHADDTDVFATSEETLIQSLNLFSNYCNQWKLDINYDKTKVLIEYQLKLFDNLVVTILTYGCEVWGFGDLSGIEKVHTIFSLNVLK